MAWDDVVIGDGEKIASAIHVFDIKGEHGISQNRFAFWISDCYLGVDMTIYKSSPEGKELAEMIEKEVPLEAINLWLTRVVMDNISRDKLFRKIERAIDDAYKEGWEDRAEAIRKALGVS